MSGGGVRSRDQPADPYGISGAVAPWRSLDAIEPIVERNITERDAEEGRQSVRQCPLPDCNPKRVGCLLHTRAKKPKPSRDLLERMALDGYGPEDDSQGHRIQHIDHRDVHERIF